MKSSHKKELWFSDYQYEICISWKTDNRLCGDVPCLLWDESRPDYKHIKSGQLESILSMGELKEIIWIIYHIKPNSWYIYPLQELFSTGNQNILTISTKIYHAWFDEYNSNLFTNSNHTHISLILQHYPKRLFTIWICLALSHVKLMLSLLYFSIQPLLNIYIYLKHIIKHLVDVRSKLWRSPGGFGVGWNPPPPVRRGRAVAGQEAS